MTEAEYFSRPRAIDLIDLMIRKARENPSPALKELLTGSNAHSLEMALFALDQAKKDMARLESICIILDK